MCGGMFDPKHDINICWISANANNSQRSDLKTQVHMASQYITHKRLLLNDELSIVVHITVRYMDRIIKKRARECFNEKKRGISTKIQSWQTIGNYMNTQKRAIMTNDVLLKDNLEQ